MMSDKHAFSTQRYEYDGPGNVLQYQEPGMTLRDYFAAKAMAVDYANSEIFQDEDWRMGVALDAYKMADAMIKASGRKTDDHKKTYMVQYKQYPPDGDWQFSGPFYSEKDALKKYNELAAKLPRWCSLQCLIIPKENE